MGRPSFFRFLFRSLKSEDELPEDLQKIMMELSEGFEDDDDEEGAETEDYLEAISDVLTMINDQLIPFAVRWYTNEADPDDDDDDEPPPKGGKKGGGRGPPKASKKNKGKSPK